MPANVYDIYEIRADFTGHYSELNFEQRAVVIENAARLDLGLQVERYGGSFTEADVGLWYADFLIGR